MAEKITVQLPFGRSLSVVEHRRMDQKRTVDITVNANTQVESITRPVYTELPEDTVRILMPPGYNLSVTRRATDDDDRVLVSVNRKAEIDVSTPEPPSVVDCVMSPWSVWQPISDWSEWTADPVPDPAVNVASQANGGVATASSSYNVGGENHPPSGANNGDRKALNWSTGGGWADSTENAFPDWLQITFDQSYEIDEIDVFTLQDNFTAPIEPTSSMTFSLYGITAFQVQYLSGGEWVNVTAGVVTGNNRVWRRFTFTPITTTAIRVLVNAALASFSRIAEVEAWTVSSPATESRTRTLRRTRTIITPASGGGASCGPTSETMLERETRTPPDPPPVIQSFTASSNSITAGQSATLNANVTNATELLLNGNAVTFPLIVTPGSTTAYSLVANGPGGSDTESLTITVTPAGGGGGGGVTSSNWADRSAGAVKALRGNSAADIGNELGSAYLNGTETVAKDTNDYGFAPEYDPAMNAIKFTIPGTNVSADPSGAWWIRFTRMPNAGNGSYWIQFRMRVDANYMNTVYKNADGSLQEGLKYFTAGPHPSTALPFGGTNVWGKLVFTNVYGYRFPTMYVKDGRSFSDWPTFELNYQNQFPACHYLNEVRLGSTTYPPPNAPPCKSVVADTWMTILINIATGPRIANPNYPATEIMPEVFENTRIRWWRHIDGEPSAYTLVHNWGPGAENYRHFNAMEDYFPGGVRTWEQTSLGQFVFETYMTPAQLLAGLMPMGVDAYMWIKEFIVHSKASTLAPDVAIPLPAADSALTPAWRSGLTLETFNEIPNSYMGFVNFDGPPYEPWNTAANNPTNGHAFVWDQDGVNAWGGFYYDVVRCRQYYAHVAGHSSRVQKNSVHFIDYTEDAPIWKYGGIPSSPYSEMDGPTWGQDTCRDAWYADGKPAGQHSFNQSDWVFEMGEGPRIVAPTNRAATRQTELNNPTPANNAFRINQKQWCLFSKDNNGVTRATLAPLLSVSDMGNFISSAPYPGTRIGYFLSPNSATSHLWKYEEFEDCSCQFTGVSSNATFALAAEGYGMIIDGPRDRAIWAGDTRSLGGTKYFIACENISTSPTWVQVEITGADKTHLRSGNTSQLNNIQHSLANDTYYVLESVTGALIAITPWAVGATTAACRFVGTAPVLPLNTAAQIQRQFKYYDRLRGLMYTPQFWRGSFFIPTAA